ncbi:hypothetical protein TRAPUB_3147 [Trametes pubescens]|uniref:DNA-binding protein n=1 Tax=Trametes pubescens TaxID=154538 RepID=A0A1M2VEF7_TRAPU|nr:hypothetical protein TRAPUB_3147 [Trametes pubescens]
MVKSREEIIAEFHEDVNMTVEELEKWLEDPKSTKAGTGVGIESGHKIIEILRKNPDKDPEKYDEDDIAHMRKVASYAKRHLAQEDHLKDTKTREELENTKSTISLKNWGHDPVKTLDGEGPAKGDEEQPDVDVVENGVSGNSDGPNAQENGESSEKPQKDNTSANKRKLDADDSGERGEEPVAADSAAADTATAAKDVSVDKEDGEGVDEDLADRPRKKSKVNGEE